MAHAHFTTTFFMNNSAPYPAELCLLLPTACLFQDAAFPLSPNTESRCQDTTHYFPLFLLIVNGAPGTRTRNQRIKSPMRCRLRQCSIIYNSSTTQTICQALSIRENLILSPCSSRSFFFFASQIFLRA